ncbi:MFS transporter [Kordiimonas sp.]|uniref:MFS transporter n=1 Tax=Kordiimonas sp. TaxID=1970157 RepID=UPI003A903A24
MPQQHGTADITKALRTLWPLFAAVAAFVAAGSLQNALVAYDLARAGASSLVTGVVMSAYFAGFLFGACVAPRLAARLNLARLFMAVTFLYAPCTALFSFTGSVPTFLILQLVTGFGIACQYVVVESWLNLEADSTHRARIFGIYMFFWFLGAGGGPLFMSLHTEGHGVLFIVAAGLVLVSGFLMFRIRNEVWQGAVALPMPLRPVMTASPSGFFATLLVGVSFGAVLGLTAAYGQHKGLSASETAFFVAAFIFGGGLTQYIAGALSDRLDRRLVLTAFTFLAALCALLLLAAVHKVMVMACAAAFGAFALPIYALAVAQIQDTVDEGERIATSGGLLILNGFGSFIGPLVIGGMSLWWGDASLFITLTLVHLLIGGIYLFRLFARLMKPATA